MARTVPGRPAPMEVVTPGNSTTSRNGSTGRVSRSLIVLPHFLPTAPGPRQNGEAGAGSSTGEVHRICHPPPPYLWGRIRACRMDLHGGAGNGERGTGNTSPCQNGLVRLIGSVRLPMFQKLKLRRGPAS